LRVGRAAVGDRSERAAPARAAAGVEGAHVAVVAIDVEVAAAGDRRVRAHPARPAAGVAGAEIAVRAVEIHVAAAGDRHRHAAVRLDAAVHGAGVHIVAGEGHRGDAGARFAELRAVAGDAVRARCAVGDELIERTIGAGAVAGLREIADAQRGAAFAADDELVHRTGGRDAVAELDDVARAGDRAALRA